MYAEGERMTTVTEKTGETTIVEMVQAKYLAGCDAALSRARDEYDKSIRVLISLSRIGDNVVRRRCVECLVQVGGKRAVVGLMDMMDDPDPSIREAAMDALGSLRAHSAVDRLKDSLTNDPDMRVRLRAARVLGKLGNLEGLPLVMHLLEQNDEYYKRLAAGSLKDIIGKHFAPNKDGVKSARRYLSVHSSKFCNGDK